MRTQAQSKEEEERKKETEEWALANIWKIVLNGEEAGAQYYLNQIERGKRSGVVAEVKAYTGGRFPK